MHAVQLKKSQNYHIQLGQAKLIHSLSSGIFEIHMQVGDHFHIYHNSKQCFTAAIQ